MADTSKKETWYALTESSKDTPAPKKSLLGTKCPKCGGKLQKESIKEWCFAGADGSAFDKMVATKAGLPETVFNLNIEKYNCKCGYEYARADAEAVGEE